MLGFMDAYNQNTDDWSAYVKKLDILANEIMDNIMIKCCHSFESHQNKSLQFAV